MDQEYVPYEIALELKQLGFDEYCMGACYYEWQNRGKTQIVLHTPDEYDSHDGVKAPLFQQAFRWFREKNGIGSWIHHYFDMDKGTFIYSYVLTLPHRGEKYVYDTHEEAELACLKKLIEIVKGK